MVFQYDSDEKLSLVRNQLTEPKQAHNDHKYFFYLNHKLISSMSQITSSLSTDCFKDISKDTFSKFKKVRPMHTPLMGDHSLYSKDGVKYIVKELPSDKQFFTTRPCSSVFIHKYTAPKSLMTCYIYPIIGIGLEKVIDYSNMLKHSSESKMMGSQSSNQTEAAKEYANLLSRHCNSLEKVLLYVLKFLMQMTLIARHQEHLIKEINEKTNISQYSSTKSLLQSGTKHQKISSTHNDQKQFPPLNIPILLECISVHNGELFYCYDTWMNSQTQIVLNDVRQIENLFLEKEQLRDMEITYVREMKLNVQREKMQKSQTNQILTQQNSPVQNQQKSLSLFSSLFKSFLLTLYVGSMELNLRLYEWGEFSLSYQNLQKRIYHFKLKHNSRDKLANLLEKVLLSQKPPSQPVKLSEILLIFKDASTNQDLTSSVCKSDLQSSTIKAPKRVALVKKNKISNFDQIQLCQSIVNNQSSSIVSSLQYASLTHQQPFAQTTDFSQNYQSCRQENNNSKHSAVKNRTLSNMVLKECNSLQKLQGNEILIIDEKEVFDCNKFKNNSLSKKQPLTSTKKNKQNLKNYSAFSGQQQKHKPPMNSTTKTIKKALFTPKLITHIIQSFQNLSQLSGSSFCSLVKLLGLEYLETQSSLEELVLKKLSYLIVNQNWVTKQYSDNSFYFGEVSTYYSQNNKKIDKNHKGDQCDPLKRHGVGVYVFPSKDLYFGNWINNLMQGRGTYLFQSGQVYSGELLQGHKQGFGSFWYSDAKKYQGFWINDKKVGLGTVYFSPLISSTKQQVVKFLGQFKQGKCDNEVEGIFTGYDTSDKVWSKQGTLNQFDVLTFQFKQKTKKNRFDTIQNPTKTQKLMNCSVSKYREFIDSLGKKYTGQVEEDLKNGYGIEQTCEYHFEGNFVNDQRNGKGKLSTKDNLVIEGAWQDGIMVEYIWE